MPLSNEEIESLKNKAESYLKYSGLPELEQSLKCYNLIINNTTPHSHYFFIRSMIKHRLALESIFYNYNEAIEDINRAIELEPDRSLYYRLRGEYLSIRLTELFVTDNEKVLLLKRIIDDYYECRKRNPKDSQVWLNLMETNILMQNYDEAIVLYGSCKPHIKNKEENLIRSWLGCLSLALAGDEIMEEDMIPLRQNVESEKIDIVGLVLRFVKLKTYLNVFYKENVNSKSLKKTNEIQWLFTRNISGSVVTREARYNESIELSRVNDEELPCLVLLPDKLKNLEKILSMDSKYDVDLDDILGFVFKEYQMDNAETWYKKGVLLHHLFHSSEAIEAYNKVIAINGNSGLTSAAWFNQGVIFEESKQYEEAIDAYSKAISSETDTHLAAIGWYNIGNCKCIKNHGEALVAYERAIALNQNFGEAWCKKAEILENLNCNDEALSAYDKSINYKPYYAIFRSFFIEACKAKANLCEIIGRHSESYEALDNLILLEGGRPFIWLDEVKVLKKLGRYEAALEICDKCITPSLYAFYIKASIFSLIGNKFMALDFLSRSIQKERAREDEDFKELWDDEDFQKIVR